MKGPLLVCHVNQTSPALSSCKDYVTPNSDGRVSAGQSIQLSPRQLTHPTHASVSAKTGAVSITFRRVIKFANTADIIYEDLGRVTFARGKWLANGVLEQHNPYPDGAYALDIDFFSGVVEEIPKTDHTPAIVAATVGVIVVLAAIGAGVAITYRNRNRRRAPARSEEELSLREAGDSAAY